MAPKKKPATKKPAGSRSGGSGGNNDKRAQERYERRLLKKKVKEVAVQWDSTDQLDAERQLQKWQLAKRAKLLESSVAENLS